MGDFRIEVRIGDELTIRYKDFETVYYTIKSNERIEVQVETNKEERTLSKYSKRLRSNPESFKSLIDSADVYLKKDARKSIQFISEALVETNSAKENGIAYESLGDIYFYWKQYDLAVSNYRVSLQSANSNEVSLKLANAYKLNKNYQESIQTYKALNKRELTNWQLVSLYEGLGDVYLLTKDFNISIDNYKQGLTVAQNHLIKPKETDLNSKIAQAYSAKGDADKAKGFFYKSLNLANSENKKRAVSEKLKVADFQNDISDYSEEIQLRKEALNTISEIEADSVFENESPLTPQKQNYKIGNAYASQGDVGNAISYLEKKYC